MWLDELKDKVVQVYLEGNPTPYTTTNIIKDIAESTQTTPNSIRMVLTERGVYVKRQEFVETDKKVCGLHVENNLQYLLAEDNISKGNNFK